MTPRFKMRTSLFDFDLPPDRIALRPAVPRDAARLLVVRAGGVLEDRGVRDLPDLLRAGDALVVAETGSDEPDLTLAGWDTIDSRIYGAARVSFLRRG